MWTEHDAKELRRLMRKRARSIPGTNAWKSVQEWNRSVDGRESQRRYRKTDKGKRCAAAYKAKGSRYYAVKLKRIHESIMEAENHRQGWTSEQDSKLVRMVNEGFKTREIAVGLGRSLKGIERRRNKLRADLDAIGK